MTDYTDTTPSILQEELVRIAKRAHSVYVAVSAALGYDDILPWDELSSGDMGESLDICSNTVTRVLKGRPLILKNCFIDTRIELSIYDAVVKDALKLK